MPSQPAATDARRAEDRAKQRDFYREEFRRQRIRQKEPKPGSQFCYAGDASAEEGPAAAAECGRPSPPEPSSRVKAAACFCSGAAYEGVPTNCPVRVSRSRPCACARASVPCS